MGQLAARFLPSSGPRHEIFLAGANQTLMRLENAFGRTRQTLSVKHKKPAKRFGRGSAAESGTLNRFRQERSSQ